MKIVTKLYSSYIICFLLVFIMLFITFNMLTQMNNKLSNVVEERYSKVKITNNIRNEVNNISVFLRNIVLAESNEQMQKNNNLLIQSSQKISIFIEELSFNKEGIEEYVVNLRIAADTYFDIENEIVSLVVSGRKVEASRLLVNEGQQARNDIYNIINEINQIQEDAMNQTVSRSSTDYNGTVLNMLNITIIGLIAGVIMSIMFTRSINYRIKTVTNVMNSIDSYDEAMKFPRIEVDEKDEIGEIASSYNDMVISLEKHAYKEQELFQKVNDQNWLNSKIAEISTIFQGIQDLNILGKTFIRKITPMVGAGYGVFYIVEGQGEEQCLNKLASYAYNRQPIGSESFNWGEGLVGQCALDNKSILITQVPENYAKIISGIGMATPKSILIHPVEFQNKVLAVVELASFSPVTSLQQELLRRILGNIGVTINRISAYMQINKLLKQSQVLSEELQSQSEEMQLQHEELNTFNEKLEDQFKKSEEKTKELEKVKADLEEKARLIEQSSKYKSEFLSNVSHELRTPLNSLLILSQILSENNEANLTPKQVEYAKTIFSSGSELLNLINEILDLSKIESGKVIINPENVDLAEIKKYLERYFVPVAHEKSVNLEIQIDSDLPESIYSDEQRVKQILKNLLANAFKFTDQGSVLVQMKKAKAQIFNKIDLFKNTDLVFEFTVTDTGIGISKEKQNIIFEAFQQGDGRSIRKYGGTGLGLSISQNIARLLGGIIEIDSAEGQGSTFTLYLPNYSEKTKVDQMDILALSDAEVAATNFNNVNAVESEEQTGQALNIKLLVEGRKILIIDDDMRNIFAITSALENKKMKVLFAENGREGIDVLSENQDIDLVLMDIMMPEMDGYEAIGRIRQNPKYERLPIIALTAKAMKNDREKCIKAGASDYISKPVNLEQLFSLIKVWLYK